MLVEKGQAKVNVHDYVTKGQLLVSGIIGREEKPEVVSATGKIMGETWYKATVKMPLKTRFSVYNGDEYSNYYLTGEVIPFRFGDLVIQLISNLKKKQSAVLFIFYNGSCQSVSKQKQKEVRKSSFVSTQKNRRLFKQR